MHRKADYRGENHSKICKQGLEQISNVKHDEIRVIKALSKLILAIHN